MRTNWIKKIGQLIVGIAGGLLLAGVAGAAPVLVESRSGADSRDVIESIISFDAFVTLECRGFDVSAGGLTIEGCGELEGTWYFDAGPLGENFHYSVFTGNQFWLLSDDMAYDRGSPGMWSTFDSNEDLESITFWWSAADDGPDMPAATIPEPGTLGLLLAGLLGFTLRRQRPE